MWSRFVFIFTLIFPFAQVHAADFTAALDTHRVYFGESVTLQLSLSGGRAETDPDMSEVEQDFAILSQHRSDSTQIFNGTINRQLVWSYTLEPKKQGTLTLPAVSIETNKGTLSSQALKITVTENTGKRDDGLSVEGWVSNASPYLHEPFFYIVRVYHHGELQEVQAVPPANDVIVEHVGKPQSQRVELNGEQKIVTQTRFLLTPLKAGAIDLGLPRVKALKAERQRQRRRSFFDMDTSNYRPINLVGKAVPVTIQNLPAKAVQPWLPLKKLTLNDDWETDLNQEISAGVPLIRSITLEAEGMGGQSLPKLDKYFANQKDFRIRSAKPETERKLLEDGTPVTTLKQSISIIPLNTGELELPALRIPWWDVKEKEVKWTELAAQKITVAAGQTVAQIAPSPMGAPQTVVKVVYDTRLNIMQHSVLSIAVITLCIALFLSWQTRNTTISVKTSSKKKAVSNKYSLAQAHTAEALQQFVQYDAQQRWQLPAHSALRKIIVYIEQNHVENEAFIQCVKQLDAHLYGGQQTLEIEAWKTAYSSGLKQLKEKQQETIKGSELVLNP